MTNNRCATADKIADYEDELHRKDHTNTSPQRRPNTASSNTSRSPARDPSTPAPSQSRFGALLGSRKLSSTPDPNPSPQQQLTRRESHLQAALEREQGLRQQAEGKVSAMSTEIEDLSTQLFQQANEMVADERRARAKLEERVEILEKRDSEKRKRLERLEMALKRIDRVKGLLGS